MRSVKCLHWFKSDSLKSLILDALGKKGEEDAPFFQVKVCLPPRPLELKCPKCERSLAIEIND